MRTLTTKEYEVISKIYNSTDEIEANLSFEFGIQNDLLLSIISQLFRGQSVMNYTKEELYKHSGELLRINRRCSCLLL